MGSLQGVNDLLIIVGLIFVGSAVLFMLFKPKQSTYVPLANPTIKSNKKAANKKKRKNKDSASQSQDATPEQGSDVEEEFKEIVEVEMIKSSLLKRRKSIELDTRPNILEEDIFVKHEPHFNEQPNRPILKNRTSRTNVDLNAFGVYFEHKITPKDEVEILHKRKNSLNTVELLYNNEINFASDENAMSPWTRDFVEVESPPKKAPVNKLVESHVQTEPLEDLKNMVNELNAKLNKSNKDLKLANDDLANTKNHLTSLHSQHQSLVTREGDISRTCQGLQAELAQVIQRIKSMERERDSFMHRVNSVESDKARLDADLKSSRHEKTISMQENQQLRTQMNSLNNKLTLMNTFTNENMQLKTRLDQTERELMQVSRNQSQMAEKEVQLKSELNEVVKRSASAEGKLQRALQDLDLERHRMEQQNRDICKLREEKSSQARTLESLKEQFAALSQKQIHMDNDKKEKEHANQACLNEMRAQVATLVNQLHQAQAESKELRAALELAKQDDEMVVVNVDSESSSSALAESLKQKLDEAEKSAQGHAAQSQELAVKMKSLMTELSGKTQALSKVQEEKRQLTSQLDSHKEALRQADETLVELQLLAEQEESQNQQRLRSAEAEAAKLRAQIDAAASSSITEESNGF